MSVRMTSTCMPHSYARYSAVVSARRGVMMRSMVGSLARFRNSVTRSIAPFSSKSCRKNRAASMLTPIAANTIANSSVLCSSPSRCTSPACRQICAATSLCGKPAPENRGIFCPRAIEFITSMVEMPVWIISSGYVRFCGLIGIPWISRNASGSTGGPPSIGFPEPLKIRPNISRETGVFRISPVNSQCVRLLSIPVVPSNTCTTALSPFTSSTCPRRTEPSPSVMFTISAYVGFFTLSRITNGPFTAATVR
mmetsp:Transcript_3047/g.8408  ORF Transcript_3047/g.8408 Transcript_3047/m.8408 type:complete len:252 (-) Transcript_3047:107-862(-)